MTFEIENNQSIVCTWNKQWQFWQSKKNLPENLPVVKRPLDKDRQILPFFSGLHTMVPAHLIPPSTHCPPTTKRVTLMGGDLLSLHYLLPIL